MNPLFDSNLSVGEAAAAWLARHDRGLTADEYRAFATWRDADHRHAEEFARLEEEWGGFAIAQTDPALVAMARELDESTRRAARRVLYFPRAVWMGAAAAAAIVLAGVFWWQNLGAGRHPGTSAYQVVLSTAHEMRLPDGSLVELRGDSEVTVDYTPDERRVRLVRGEALFAVAKNAERPFIVSAGSVAVRAVGTAFNVRLGDSAVDVLVTEGRVRVDESQSGRSLLPTPTPGEPPVLTAGERVTVGLDAAVAPAAIVPVAPAEVDQMLAWQRTRLVFNRTSLADAVDAFSRHGNGRIEIGDDDLRDRLLGGTFRADNVEAFVRLLEQGAGVRAEHRADGTTVLRDAK